MNATAVGRLAEARERVTIAALVLHAAMSPDPSASIDALAAIAPTAATKVCEELADRDDTTPAAILAAANLHRIELLASSRPSPNGAAA